jgi:hypothetical protein
MIVKSKEFSNSEYLLRCDELEEYFKLLYPNHETKNYRFKWEKEIEIENKKSGLIINISLKDLKKFFRIKYESKLIDRIEDMKDDEFLEFYKDLNFYEII